MKGYNKRYDFQDKKKADNAAKEIYSAISSTGLVAVTQNVCKDPPHHIYRFHPPNAASYIPDSKVYPPGTEVMKVEFNGTQDPATIEIDYGTSKDKVTLEKMVTVTVAKFGGVEGEEKIEGPSGVGC